MYSFIKTNFSNKKYEILHKMIFFGHLFQNNCETIEHIKKK